MAEAEPKSEQRCFYIWDPNPFHQTSTFHLGFTIVVHYVGSLRSFTLQLEACLLDPVKYELEIS